MFRAMTTAATLLLLSSATVWAADGAAVYKSHCAACHGADGKADTPMAKTMKVPALAGDANVAKMSVDDVIKRIQENPKHPAGVKSMGKDDADAVAAFVKQISGGK
jgi:mono/diheme cytochrome c family protein